MKKNYLVKAWVKGDRGGVSASVIRDTIPEAEAWINEHRATENNAHAYQVLCRYFTEDEWQLTMGYYLVNGQEITERQFIDIMYSKVGS